MRLVSFGMPGAERPGALDSEDNIVALDPIFARWGIPAPEMNAVIGLLPMAQKELEREVEDAAVRLEFGSVRLGAPIPRPRAIFGIGMNYPPFVSQPTAPRVFKHAPPVFLKPQHSLVGPRDQVELPSDTTMLDFEVEIAIVIGRHGRRIRAEDAGDYVAGLMVANDFTAHDIVLGVDDVADLRFPPGPPIQLAVGKGFDGFLPTGPWVSVGSHALISDLWLTSEVNGERRQEGSARDMILDLPHIVQLISHFATVSPGDIILTGTPSGCGVALNPPVFLEPGDGVRVEVNMGLGVLENRMVAASA